MKKSDIIFYSICFLGGLFNPWGCFFTKEVCWGGWLEVFYVILVLAVGMTISTLFKRKYEK